MASIQPKLMAKYYNYNSKGNEYILNVLYAKYTLNEYILNSIIVKQLLVNAHLEIKNMFYKLDITENNIQINGNGSVSPKNVCVNLVCLICFGTEKMSYSTMPCSPKHTCEATCSSVSYIAVFD